MRAFLGLWIGLMILFGAITGAYVVFDGPDIFGEIVWVVVVGGLDFLAALTNSTEPHTPNWSLPEWANVIIAIAISAAFLASILAVIVSVIRMALALSR